MTTVQLLNNGELARIELSWERVEEIFTQRFRVQFQGKRKVGYLLQRHRFFLRSS